MSKLFLVMNPGSRSFRCRYAWPGIFERLRALKADFDFALTEREGHAIQLARTAARSGFDTIVAVGGDGTINEAINGLFPPDVAKGLASFGVIYTGTSPDFCRYHGIPLASEAAIDLILSGKRRRVDVCRIIHKETPDGEAVQRVFSCSANFGLGAAVARGSNSGLRKVWGDFLGTLFSVLSAIFHYRSPIFRVTMNGRKTAFSRVFNIFIGKNPLVASGIKLNLNIAPDDGRLYVLPLNGLSKFKLLAILPQIYTGSLTRRFQVMYGSDIQVSCPEEFSEVEYDGDPRGFLPAQIRVLPCALELIRPD